MPPRIAVTQTTFLESADLDHSAQDISSTFIDNLSLPIHNWFRYPAGFSAKWVHELIEQEKLNDRKHILDPFCGSGTTLLEGELCGVEAIGIESHPFVARLARTKLYWRENPSSFCDHALSILEQARRNQVEIEVMNPPKLLTDCYPLEVLARLESLKIAWSLLIDG